MRQTRALTTFSVGLLAGALSVGAALVVLSGLLSPLPLPLRSYAFLGVALLALLREAGVEPLPFPQLHRQVPREVFEEGLATGALRFGFELGLGFRTYISASSAYVLAGGIALLGIEPLVVVAAAVGFAVGRSIPSWMRYWDRRGGTWDDALRGAMRWFKPLGVPLVAAGLLTSSYAAF